MILTNLPGGKGPSLEELGLTIVHPFYNEKERFLVQLENWKAMSDRAKDTVHIVIADDSSNPPVHSFIPEGSKLDFNLDIYRIEEDLKWNTPGALNLGIVERETEWVLIMDSDCLLQPEELDKLLTLRPNKDYNYWFERKRITDNPDRVKVTRFLPCSILFHEDAFITVGGFDEDFTGARSGGYGFFDNYFAMRLNETCAPKRLIKDIFITEYMEDKVGPNIQTRTGVQADTHHRTNKKLMYAKVNGTKKQNFAILRFDWETTFHNERKNDQSQK